MAFEAEPQLEDPTLALGQVGDGLPHGATAERVGRLLLGIARGRIAEEIAELAVLIGAEGLIQGDRCLGRVEGLVDVLKW